MLGLLHVALQVTLCGSIARLPANAPVAMRVVLANQTPEPQVLQTVRFARGTGAQTMVELQAPPGVYRLLLDTQGRTPCSGLDYVVVLPGHDRTVPVKLYQGNSDTLSPALVAGTFPAGDRVEFAVYDMGVCNATLPGPTADLVRTRADGSAYYASIYPTARLRAGRTRVVVVRITDANGEERDMRLPVHFPQRDSDGFASWPSYQRFDITPDLVRELESQQGGVLLCPHVYETSAG